MSDKYSEAIAKSKILADDAAVKTAVEKILAEHFEENNNQEFTNKVESKEPEEDHKTMKTVYTDTRGYNVGSKFIPEDDEVGGFEKTRKSNRLENNGY